MKRLFFSLVFIASLLSAQDVEVYFNHSAEEYFLLGMRQYSQKEFKPALLSFQRSLFLYPGNHRTTASMIMAAKSDYALKNYSAAASMCDSILQLFPSSLYREDAYFTLGMCHYNQGEYWKTFEEMQRTYVIAQQRLNKEHSLKVIEHLAAEFFPEQEIDSLLVDSLHIEIKNLLRVILAERFFQGGRIDEAKQQISLFDPAAADQLLQFRINRVIARIDKGNLVRIGVLLPLQKENIAENREKKIVNEILEGIQLAVSDYEERTIPGQISLELDIQDSKKDSATIQSIITGWGEDNTIIGIVGPVFSAESMTAAVIAQERGIPIITPTASDEGISSIGPNVFQANSTNGAKGKTLAQYAVNILRAKTIAVLGSSLQSAATQADSFIAEAKRLGAAVLVDRRFRRNETDLRQHVRAIRLESYNLRPDYVLSLKGKINLGEATRKLLSVGVKLSYIDSVLANGGLFNFTPFFGDSAKAVADTLRLPAKKTLIYMDSLHYPVTAVDLVYCPISNSHEIGVITSQLTFFNIKATVLGSGDWNDANELDLNKRYAEGAIFGSDRWIERDDRTQRIYTKYAMKYGKQISDNALYGYDVMSLLIHQFSEGSLSREQLSASLATVFEFPGIRNAVTLNPDRVNSSLHILQYKNGAVTKMQTYSYH
jgi:ABC-type branched-subunit amino acid transport system substrate-binding protein